MHLYRLNVVLFLLLVSIFCISATGADHKSNNEIAFYRVSLSAPIDRDALHVQDWQLDKDLVLHGLGAGHSVCGVVIEYVLGSRQNVRWIDDTSVYKLDVQIDAGGVSGVFVDLEFKAYRGGERAGGTSVSRFPVLAQFEEKLVVLPPLLNSGKIEEVYAIVIRAREGWRRPGSDLDGLLPKESTSSAVEPR